MSYQSPFIISFSHIYILTLPIVTLRIQVYQCLYNCRHRLLTYTYDFYIYYTENIAERWGRYWCVPNAWQIALQQHAKIRFHFVGWDYSNEMKPAGTFSPVCHGRLLYAKEFYFSITLYILYCQILICSIFCTQWIFMYFKCDLLSNCMFGFCTFL